MAYDPADWLPLVDPDEYDPLRWTNRNAQGYYGGPRTSQHDWLRQQARTLWTRARLDWCKQYGWPGGKDVLDLLRESRENRYRALTHDHRQRGS